MFQRRRHDNRNTGHRNEEARNSHHTKTQTCIGMLDVHKHEAVCLMGKHKEGSWEEEKERRAGGGRLETGRG